MPKRLIGERKLAGFKPKYQLSYVLQHIVISLMTVILLAIVIVGDGIVYV